MANYNHERESQIINYWKSIGSVLFNNKNASNRVYVNKDPSKKIEYNTKASTYHAFDPDVTLNILDYCEYTKIPVKPLFPGPRNIDYKIDTKRMAQEQRDKFLTDGRDFSSVNIRMVPRSDGKPSSGIWNRLSKNNVGHDSHVKNQKLNPLISFIKEVNQFGTIDEANKEKAKMISEYGKYTHYAISDHGITSISKDLGATNNWRRERLEENNGSIIRDYTKTDYPDNGGKHNTKDKDLVRKYLVEKRKLRPKLVNNLMDLDLIRTNKGYYQNQTGNQIPPCIEFAHKRPKNLTQAKGPFDPNNELTVGADRIFLKEQSDGTYDADNNAPSSNRGKQIVSKSEKLSGFSLQTGNGKQNLVIVESPIDAISYYQIMWNNIKDTDTTILSLGGSTSKMDAIKTFESAQLCGTTQPELKSNHEPSLFKNIVFAVDNDNAGRRSIGGATVFSEDKSDINKESDHNYLVHRPPFGKDWNESVVYMDKYGYPKTPVKINQSMEEFFTKSTVDMLSVMKPSSRLAIKNAFKIQEDLYNDYLHGKTINPNSEKVVLLRNELKHLDRGEQKKYFEYIQDDVGATLSPGEMYKEIVQSEKANILNIETDSVRAANAKPVNATGRTAKKSRFGDPELPEWAQVAEKQTRGMVEKTVMEDSRKQSPNNTRKNTSQQNGNRSPRLNGKYPSNNKSPYMNSKSNKSNRSMEVER